ncbi:hypothetical protein [Bifidobacterium sp. ESL0764]|uniref:hypothetical protein n=1 Tax=Bifidobacterium sp. ESL0764 TaxID=2983228 RepID=UPI0023F77F96|nr:hypothetical protein [Bifidobacterium sp. ESL0764]WEV65609.1 hypothetical protein OZX71_07645 [Bifidobacterium sp. ESL0764]
MIAKRKRPSRVTQLEFVQRPDKWPLAKGCEHDPRKLLERIVHIFEEHGHEVIIAYGIMHDSDIYQVLDYLDPHPWFSIHKPGSPKPDHDHFLVHLRPGDGVTLKDAAEWLGLDPQYVEKMKQGKYGWDDACSYMTHYKTVWKHQYSPDDVVTVCGPPYAKLFGVRRLDWFAGRQYVNSANIGKLLPVLEQMVREGKLDRDGMVSDDGVFEVMSYLKRKDRKELEDLADMAGEHIAAKKAERMRREGIPVALIWFHGQGSGSGKTLGAETLARRLREAFGWKQFDTTTTHVMEGYRSEDVVVIDEFDQGSLRFSEVLQLTDPMNIHRSDSRYKKTGPIVARVIIVTSSASLQDIVALLAGRESHGMPMDEILRRITVYIDAVGYELSPEGSSEPRRHGYDIYTPQLSHDGAVHSWELSAPDIPEQYDQYFPGDDHGPKLKSMRGLEYVGSVDSPDALADTLMDMPALKASLPGGPEGHGTEPHAALETDLGKVKRRRMMLHLKSAGYSEAAVTHLIEDHWQTAPEASFGWQDDCLVCAMLKADPTLGLEDAKKRAEQKRHEREMRDAKQIDPMSRNIKKDLI